MAETLGGGLDLSKFTSFLSAAGIPTPKEYTKDQTAILEKERAERAPLLEKQGQNIAKMFDLAKQLKEAAPPAAPNLQDVPARPDAEYKDPTQALGSMASVLALLGSFKTRAPLTAALNSAAAAMEGFRAGDMQRVKLEREKWHDNFERALQQNQVEINRYNAALAAAKFDMEKARPMFEAIAAENQHTGMLLAAQAGDYKAMHAIYDGGIKVGEQMVQMYIKDQEFRLSKQLAAAQHAATREQTAAYREQAQAYRETLRSDVNTRWFVANAQKVVKPYQETIRRVNDIEANLIPGMELPDTVKVQLKQLAGTRQVGKWTQGLDKYTGDIITRIFSAAEKGTLGRLSQQDADAMKAFVANVKAVNAAEIESIKTQMRPFQKQYNIPEGIFGLPFTASAPLMSSEELAYPGLDQNSREALGIVGDMVGR